MAGSGGLARERGGSDSRRDLQWATCADAADDAGISRLLGGIHVSPDDFEGRKLGAICGRDAWVLARKYFEGTA